MGGAKSRLRERCWWVTGPLLCFQSFVIYAPQLLKGVEIRFVPPCCATVYKTYRFGQRNWVLPRNLNFLIPRSFQPDVLIFLSLTEFTV